MGFVLSVLDEEKAVGRRLAQFRRFQGQSQAALAKAAGLTRGQLANVEIGRTALNFWAGWNLCRVLNLNAHYLATGSGRERPFIEFNPTESASEPIVSTDTFWEVCQQKLADELRFRNEMASQAGGSPSAATSQSGKPVAAKHPTMDELVINLVNAWLLQFPLRQRRARFEKLVQDLEGIFAAYHQLPARERAGEGKKVLQDVSESVKSPDVRPQLPKLLKDLKQATQERGMKSKLAEFLGVPLASVSQWLSGEREPGGEYVLQMQEWLKRPR